MNKNLPVIGRNQKPKIESDFDTDVEAGLKEIAFFFNITNKILGKSEKSKKLNRISYDQSKVINFEDNIEAWVDERTALMWEVKTDNNWDIWCSWNDASSHTKALNVNEFAGFNDWRIPTKDELKSILTEKEINNICMISPLSKCSYLTYWSSNIDYKNNHLFVVGFLKDRDENFSVPKENFLANIMCVRNV